MNPYSLLENVPLDALDDFQRRHHISRRFHQRMEHRLSTEYLTGYDLAYFQSWEFRQLGSDNPTGKLIEQLLQNATTLIKLYL